MSQFYNFSRGLVFFTFSVIFIDDPVNQIFTKMKIILLFTLLLCFFSRELFSQTDSTYKEGWNPSGVLSLNISQVAFKDWSLGGENSYALTSINDFKGAYKQKKVLWKNNLKITLGQTKIGDNDLQSSDNELFFESIFSYDIGWVVDPYGAITFNTVLLNGYNYDSVPAVQTSAFLDPGYLVESFGFTYERTKNFNTRLGIAFKETFTNTFTQYTDDPLTSGTVETFKFETGIESVTNVNWNFYENLSYSSKLSLFSAFDQLNVWDVAWDNTMTGKINDFVNASLSFKLVYDVDQSLRTQLKESLQIGFTYTLF